MFVFFYHVQNKRLNEHQLLAKTWGGFSTSTSLLTLKYHFSSVSYDVIAVAAPLPRAHCVPTPRVCLERGCAGWQRDLAVVSLATALGASHSTPCFSPAGGGSRLIIVRSTCGDLF